MLISIVYHILYNMDKNVNSNINNKGTNKQMPKPPMTPAKQKSMAGRFGLILGAVALGAYLYTIKSTKQEKVLDDIEKNVRKKK